MKKLISLLLSAVLLMSVLALGGCSSTDTKDIKYVKDKGTLVVGVVDAPPLTVQEDGEWSGFAIDLAKDFAKKLGVEVEFLEIDWSRMEALLNDKTIDCVSSALTLTAERKAAMECTAPYLNNDQIVVMKKSIARNYAEAEECLQLKFAVLDGSVHETLAKENGFVLYATQSTEDALKAVSDGTVDAAIINSILAGTMLGEGNEFPDLARSFRLKKTQMGFGFRQGSGLAEEMNEYFVTAYTSGRMTTMAKAYGLQKLIVEQVTEQ